MDGPTLDQASSELSLRTQYRRSPKKRRAAVANIHKARGFARTMPHGRVPVTRSPRR